MYQETEESGSKQNFVLVRIFLLLVIAFIFFVLRPFKPLIEPFFLRRNNEPLLLLNNNIVKLNKLRMI